MVTGSPRGPARGIAQVGLPSPFKVERWQRRPSMDHRLTTKIFIGDHWEQVQAALRAHATQIDPDSQHWFGLPPTSPGLLTLTTTTSSRTAPCQRRCLKMTCSPVLSVTTSEVSPVHKLLFLCTGNYYRSRFAELLFNAMAALIMPCRGRRFRAAWRSTKASTTLAP